MTTPTPQLILFNLPVPAARCQGLFGDDNQRCTNNAATYMRVGCIHEHVFVVLSCEKCTTDAERRNAFCEKCWDGRAGIPHSCAMLGVPVIPDAPGGAGEASP